MKETLKKTWEEVMACPVGSKFKVTMGKIVVFVEVTKLESDCIYWSSISNKNQRYPKKDFEFSVQKGEKWFLLEEENSQIVPQETKPTDNNIFCSCNGPSKRCDTGFAFSKVYYTCCNCKKEKR